MEAPLVIGDSDNEGHAPKRKEGQEEGIFRKQLKSCQEPVAAVGSDQEMEEQSDRATALQNVQAQEQRTKHGPKNSTLSH